MQAFKATKYRWERTTLHIEFDSSTPLSERDSFILGGQRFDPAVDDEPRDCELTLANVEVTGAGSVAIRFMVANGGYPVFPGDYQLFIRHYSATYPVVFTGDFVPPAPVSTKREDMLFYGKVSSYFEAIPHLEDDGKLWFNVNAKAFPQGFGYHARTAFKKACKTFARALVNEIAVSSFYIFKKLCRYQSKKVLFTSDSRSDLSGNMEPLVKRIRERGLTDRYKVVFSFKPLKCVGKSRSIGSYIRLSYHLATSGTVFCDDFQAYLYHVRYDKRTRLVQLWHACGHFKTVGFGRIGTADAVAPYSNDHKSYTDVIVASDSDVPVYAEAFGIPNKRVKALGIPRHDWLLDAEWQAGKKQVFDQTFPQASGKRVIVFAPTFRGAGKTTAHYDYSKFDFERLAEFCREQDFFFIFKMHPFITALPKLPAGSEDVFADGSAIREINDILPSTDVLITDYSSVVYEAALLNIPTLYFAYDLEGYVSSRSFYEPYEEFVSGRIVRTFDDLLDALRTGDCDAGKLEEFRKKNFNYLDGGACDRIIDSVLMDGGDGTKKQTVGYSADDVAVISLSLDAAAINERLASASEPFVCFVDDGAKYDDDYLEKVLKAFERNPEIGAASGLVRTHKGKLLSNEMNTDTPFIYHDAQMNFKQTKLLPYGMVYRTQVIRDAGLKFDENLTYCRDELFAIQYAQVCGKAARVNKAKYKTGIELDETSAKTPQSNDKRWYFDSTLPLLEALADDSGKLSQIAQFGLLYLTIQRFKANQGSLVKMCFESPEESAEYVAQVGEIMRHMDDEVLFCRAEAVKWERYKLIYLAQLRDLQTSLAFDVVPSGDDAKVFLAGEQETEIAKMSEIGLNVMCMKEQLDADGNRSLALTFSLMHCFPEDSFEVVFTSEAEGEVRHVQATYTTQLAGIVTFFDEDAARRDAYKALIPLPENACKQVIRAQVKVGSTTIDKKIGFSLGSWQSKLLTGKKSSYWRLGDRMVASEDGVIVTTPASNIDFKRAELRAQNTLAKLAQEAAEASAAKPKSKSLASKAQKLSNGARWRKMYWDTVDDFDEKTIWAYYDKSYKAGDNAEYAFRYAAAQDDGIEKVFFIEADSPDGQRLAAEGFKVLQPGTDEAAMYALHADVIFMTHVPPYTKLGLGPTLLPYFKDLLNAKVIRLYHGYPITRSASYAQVAHDAAAVAIGTEYERSLYMNEDNGFEESQIIESGMPRYDDLVDDSKHQLLLAPTWRPSLCGKSMGGGKSAYNPDFKESRYFKLYSAVLSDERFLACARKHGYKAKMFLHPKLSVQTCDFESNDVVEALSCTEDMDYVTIMRQSDLMVTDYSSVQYDFAYMRKPVVYYHDPALPYWRKTIFDYENIGLGDICRSADELVNTLCEYMESGCALKEEYAKRIEKFYINNDRLASKRLYEAALKL